MLENSACKKINTELREIKDLKDQFDAALEASVRSGKVGEVKTLRAKLEERARALREKLWPFESLSREKIRVQYETQVNAYRRAEILKPLSNGELGIVDISGKERPVPILENILQRFGEKREILGRKIEKGFARLLIVPVGMKIDDLVEGYRNTILIHWAEGRLLDYKGDSLELDENNPVWVWDKYEQADVNGELVYDVKEFSANHQGKLKAEIVAESETTAFPGWKVILVEDLQELVQNPTQGETKAGRPPLITGKTPREYLEVIGKEDALRNEEGIYPEDYIAMGIIQLEEKNQVLDADTATYCTGAYFADAEDVPNAYWYRDDRQASLDGSGPGNRDDGIGARSAVRVT